jgi:hypothetical protein
MVAVTCGEGLRKVGWRARSIERTASSRAERRSRKVIPDRSTRAGPRRDEASFRALSNSPIQKTSNSPHNSTSNPAPDSRTSIPYNVSHFPVIWQVCDATGRTHRNLGGLRERRGFAERRRVSFIISACQLSVSPAMPTGRELATLSNIFASCFDILRYYGGEQRPSVSNLRTKSSN